MLATPPKIYFASRTHSQLAQSVREIRNISYTPRVCVLSSRDHLCVHPEIKAHPGSPTERADMCKRAVEKKTCKYHANFEQFNGALQSSAGSEPAIADLEDLLKFGMKNSICPYYYTREQLKNADIVFLPYNYLVDEAMRRSQRIDLKNAIIIFDEAHNLEAACTESSSFEISETHIATCISELEEYYSTFSEVKKGSAAFVSVNGVIASVNLFSVESLTVCVKSLLKEVRSIPMDAKSTSMVFFGDFFINLLQSAFGSLEEAEAAFETFKQISKDLLQLSDQTREKRTKSRGPGLSSLIAVLKMSLQGLVGDGNKLNGLRRSFKVHLQISEKSERILSLWCFHSGIAMAGLVAAGARSIIAASGTLSPLESFECEMNIDFPISLSNPHVAPPTHFCVSVLRSGPTGTLLNSSFDNRQNTSYLDEIGRVVVRVAGKVPAGMLVFFAGYGMMDSCLMRWKNTRVGGEADGTLWEEICKLKKPIIEPKSKADFAKAMLVYRKLVESTKGGYLFCGLQGKGE
ncbi:hypothetical protein BC829DRAFT_69279 [Chytridium lagenaria]|nr:hypothetical protein BC829DRAFT_69279 [Chytridium lagenaria]